VHSLTSLTSENDEDRGLDKYDSYALGNQLVQEFMANACMRPASPVHV
jgi:hypothetical protein